MLVNDSKAFLNQQNITGFVPPWSDADIGPIRRGRSVHHNDRVTSSHTLSLSKTHRQTHTHTHTTPCRRAPACPLTNSPPGSPSDHTWLSPGNAVGRRAVYLPGGEQVHRNRSVQRTAAREAQPSTSFRHARCWCPVHLLHPTQWANFSLWIALDLNPHLR